MLNKVQKAAYELIQSDARFIYTLVEINNNAKNIETNYLMMCQPYIGIFADGAEQWCKKVGLKAPHFSDIEKKYYSILRGRHKLYELSYEEYSFFLMEKFYESDKHFRSIRSFGKENPSYYNVGVDLCKGEFCGNTILCALYIPIPLLENENVGIWMRNISVIAGRLAGFFDCNKLPIYRYKTEMSNEARDYHFFDNCPVKEKSELSFILFSILCTINHIICFINDFFLDEIPQKLKYAYLQYYYLCDFITEVNKHNNLNLKMDNSLQDRMFRNCLTHYGLGQYLRDDEIIENDILKGLTKKAFDVEYYETKAFIYNELKSLTSQIKKVIF